VTDYPPPSPPPGDYPPQGNYPPPPPGGYPPPPQGNYPPPPQGNYPPPPPQGNYPPPPPGGYPPPGGGFPPPPGGGYPGAYGPGFGAPTYSVGQAVSWAWNKFSKNLGPLLVATLVFAVIAIALQAIIQGLAFAVSPDQVTSYDSYESGFEYSTSVSLSGAGIFVSILGYLVMLVVGAVITSAYLGGALDIANGQQVTVGSFFKPRRVGAFVVLSLLVGILSSIGFALCVIPGLVLSIFLMFSSIVMLDRNLSPVDAMKASFDIAKNNFGQVLLAWLVAIALVILGAIACGVGLLVAVPVVLLFEVYTYRALSGGQVAPLTP
jgi:uncharacterized membrane protein